MTRSDTLSEALSQLITRAEQVLDRFADTLPQAIETPDWDKAIAFRWRRRNGRGFLQTVEHPHGLRFDDLQAIETQKQRVEQNTRQFIAGRPANNVLLTGSRGSGKSSIVKALLREYAKQGLRLIEVDKSDLVDLPDIIDLIRARPERFIVFCDDLSFEAGDSAYKELKVVLDGSVAAAPDNVLIYATSNRRHLMPEYFAENLETRNTGGEIHPGESVEEKISLSERFGLWVSFYPFDQDDYLDIVAHWLKTFDVDEAGIRNARQEALNWALSRGSRSGRVAWQFAKDYAGSLAAPTTPKKSKARNKKSAAR